MWQEGRGSALRKSSGVPRGRAPRGSGPSCPPPQAVPTPVTSSPREGAWEQVPKSRRLLGGRVFLLPPSGYFLFYCPFLWRGRSVPLCPSQNAPVRLGHHRCAAVVLYAERGVGQGAFERARNPLTPIYHAEGRGCRAGTGSLSPSTLPSNQSLTETKVSGGTR